MNSSQIRRSYLDFFRSRGHAVRASTAIIPQGDATLMFNSAGMVPFKPYFLGLRKDLSRVEIRDERADVDHAVEMADKEEVIELKPRRPVPMRSAKERIGGFEEIEIGYSEEQAREEARRCLRCDLER